MNRTSAKFTPLDPLQVGLWAGAARAAAEGPAGSRLRQAAAQRCLRSFAEALGTSEGEQQLWLCCVQGMANSLSSAGPETAAALCAAWPMLLARLTMCCPRVALSNALPPTWPTIASLLCAAAGVVLARDEGEVTGSLMTND